MENNLNQQDSVGDTQELQMIKSAITFINKEVLEAKITPHGFSAKPMVDHCCYDD